MKDVAILTKFYKNYNYGGTLQGYALYKVIKEMNYSCDIISYDVYNNPNPIYKNLFSQCKQYGINSALEKVFEKSIGKLKFLKRKTFSERRGKFDKFVDEYVETSPVYNDINAVKLNEKYRAFVSGSDQIWNPNAVRWLYLQKFNNSGKKKISYAASIGRDDLSKEEKEVIFPEIITFDCLSVREKTAREFLVNHLEKDIKVVLDPTLLVNKDEWDMVSSPRMVQSKYALFYFFSDSSHIRSKVKAFCKENGLDMVMIPYAKQEFNLGDGLGKIRRLHSVGPKEFLSCIKYADYIFTDSFHGAVFSIIFKKQFVVFERNKKGKVSMNSRLYDLLDTFGLGIRLIPNGDEYMVNDFPPIDYNKVDDILHKKQNESIGFLENALKNI